MRNLCLWAILASPVLAGPLAAQDAAPLEALLRARIAQDTAIVALVYRDPVRHEEVRIGALLRFHAASTMKIPVLLELARRVDAGDLAWDELLTVRNDFRSIVDGSPFQLDPADDSDSTLYASVGQSATVARLARLMIVRSSNLATNILIARLDPVRVNATAHRLGADSIAVLRGVEDGKAYARGLSNTTTALDLALLLEQLTGGRAASAAASDSMRTILLDQEFNDAIPAGVPSGVPVAHKTGEITAIAHDAAVVYPPGRPPYVLVILTKGFPARRDAARLMSDLSAIVYQWADRRPDPRE